jgi:NADPH:quinone reductase
MRAVVIREPGGPEVLVVREVPDLEPPFGHVRVRVHFAGVNRADLIQRAGFYPAPPGAPPDIPGLEYAGVVDALGPGSARFSVGDRVHGLVAGGAYAEQLIVHEREAVRVPEGLRDDEAAAVPEAFITAYDALVVQGRLAPGERALIHAVGSGVGTAGLQIAKALGCFVVGTSRTADKLERCGPLGLDAGIVPPRGGAFADEVRRVTGGAGVDVVLDLVGGAYIPEDIDACAVRGRVLVVSLTAGSRADVNLGAVLSKRITLIGTALRTRPLEEKIQAAQLLERNIGPWLAARKVRPIIDRTFALEEAAAAHAYVGDNQSFGKVLLFPTRRTLRYHPAPDG